MIPGALDEAKAALPIAVLWSRLGLPGEAPARDGLMVRCPFGTAHRNGDSNPSFNTYGKGQRFKCFACGAEGGAVDLVALVEGLDDAAACRRLVELAGGGGAASGSPWSSLSALVANGAPVLSVPCAAVAERPRVELPAMERAGFIARARLRKSRSISAAAVDLAVRFGVLGFASVFGERCWLLGDGSRRAVEARRLDRAAFPALGRLGDRKAHSLKGSDKSWPVGVEVLRRWPSFRAVMLLEGGPDFLAALHFADEREVGDVWPVAMLGRSVGGIHPEALALLTGRRVRLYPHADDDGGGVAAAARWAGQLAGVGCSVDGFAFTGLRQRDGSLVNDVNDACLVCDEDKAKLEGLLP